MLKESVHFDIRDEGYKFIKNILSIKNKGIVYKLEWNTSAELKVINPQSKFYNKKINFKK